MQNSQLREILQQVPEDVCQAILDASLHCVQNQNKGSNAYALAYLEAIPVVLVRHGIRGLRTQLLYVLDNLGYWRGKEAREAKSIMQKYVDAVENY